MAEFLMDHSLALYLLFALPVAALTGLAIGQTAARADEHAERCAEFLHSDEENRTQQIIGEVRRQQRRVMSRNRHLIVGQQMRRRGELVWPWEPEMGQGDA